MKGAGGREEESVDTTNVFSGRWPSKVDFGMGGACAVPAVPVC